MAWMAHPARRIAIGASLALVLIGALAAFWLHTSPSACAQCSAAGAEGDLTSIHWVEAKPAHLRRTARFQGKFVFGKQVVVKSPYAGTVKDVSVGLGGKFLRGQILADIHTQFTDDEKTLTAQREADQHWIEVYFPKAIQAQMQANALTKASSVLALNQARAKVAAVDRGISEKIAQPADLDAARRGLEDAQNQQQSVVADGELKIITLEQARLERIAAMRQLDARISSVKDQSGLAVISAPFSGAVAALNPAISQGAVQTGDFLFTLVDEEAPTIDAIISADDLQLFSYGRILPCLVNRSHVEISCKVDKVSWFNNNNGDHYVVHMTTAQLPGLEPSDTVTLTVSVAEKDAAVSAPLSAIHTEAGQKYVLIKQGGGVMRARVDTGFEGDDGVEILTGLRSGESVAVR